MVNWRPLVVARPPGQAGLAPVLPAADADRRAVCGQTAFDEAKQAAALQEAGAVAYLTKSGPSDTLIAAIRTVVDPSG